MWEDEKNSAGGRWLLQLPPAKNNPHVDDYWKNIVRTNTCSIFFYYILTLNTALIYVLLLDNEHYR